VGIVASSVTLAGRTLYKDGNWNTLCLPFDVTDNDTSDGISFTGTPLEGATAMSLKTSKSGGTGFADGTLTLNFSNATTISAGTAYIIKWTRPADYVGNESTYDITSPEFTNVAISNAAPKASTSDDQTVSFTGSYSPVSIAGEDRSILFLGTDNTLYYPEAATTIGAFRACFQLLNGITAGNPDSNDPNTVRDFRLNFGDDTTEMESLNREPLIPNHIYDLSGRRYDTMPTTKGIYVVNGRKVIVK
jgi:hypothetical protein